jgi:predicted secreted protein
MFPRELSSYWDVTRYIRFSASTYNAPQYTTAGEWRKRIEGVKSLTAISWFGNCIRSTT